MIIYGWGNFNRRDHALVRGHCRSCGRAGYLRSYTSSKFFTLYFIPVIPLGTQKIVQDCPHCKQAFGMSVRKWRKLRKTQIPAVLAAYEAKPGDGEAAKALLGSCVGLQDRETLLRIGPQVRAAFARDPDVLGFLAGAYSYLCLDREADEVYLEAVGLAPDGPVAGDANAHLELQKLPKPETPNRLLQSLPVLIVPAILLFLGLTYVQGVLSNAVKHGYVVNGLERGYTVVINGERLALRPHAVVATNAIALGDNIISIEGDPLLARTETVQVGISLDQRLFSGTTVVLNPDRAAVLLWEKVAYSSSSSPSGRGSYDHRSGELVHVFEELDFRFQEFPRSISMSSSSSVAYRTRISDVSRELPVNLVSRIHAEDGPKALAGYLEARLRAGEDKGEIVHVAARFLPRDTFLSLAESRLELSPVKIEWHRAYQTLLDGTPAGAGLEAKYRSLCDKHPEDSTFLYLLGRILDDPAASVPVFERAARMPQPSAFAANALAYHYVLEGDFAAAETWSREALKLDPGSELFRGLRRTILYGMREYVTVESEEGSQAGAGGPDIVATQARVYRLARMGGREVEIKQATEGLMDGLKRNGGLSDSDRREITASLEMSAALGARDAGRFVAAAKRLSRADVRFQCAIVGGQLDDALGLDQAHGDAVGATGHLALYALLMRAGRADDAGQVLSRAVEALSVGSGDEQRWAGWLKGTEAPRPELAVHTCWDIDQQPVWMAALAARFPSNAPAYLSRATATHTVDTYATLALGLTE